MADDHIRVAVRIRPLIQSEVGKGSKNCLLKVPGEPQVQIENTTKSFRFNHVFPPEASQEDFYQTAVKNMIPKIFNGFNVTILAYGQTGSGKTHSMGTNHLAQDNPGIIPRAVKDIFNTIKAKEKEWDFEVQASFLELYKEQLYDLLANKERDQCVVDIRDGSKSILVVNLTEKIVHNEEETLDCLVNGAKARVTGPTAMNEQSSRSHAVFTITVYQKNLVDDLQSRMAKFHFVDLAGSERSKKTQATGNRFKEGVNINKGLLALGNVISQLGDENPASYVNYRDSKLTRLLQDSLGGNSVTLMVACVSPADYNLEETLSTLRYADRARKIKNKPVVNQDPKSAEILMLKNRILELEALKGTSAIIPEDYEELGNKLRICMSKQNDQVLQIINLHEKNNFLDGVNEKLVKTLSNQCIPSLEALICEGEELMDLLESESLNMEAFKERMQKFTFKIMELKLALSKEQQNITIDSYEQFSGNTTSDDVKISIEDKMLLDATYNVEHEQFADRQEEADRQVQWLDKELADKEMMMKKLKHTLQDNYKKNVEELEKEIHKLQEEKALLQNQITNSQSSEKCSKLAEQRRKKIQELEKKITDLNRKCVEYARVMKEKENSDHQCQNLKKEILQLKQSKVKHLKDMRAEAEKFNKWKLERQRELVKLKATERKQKFEIVKMQNQHQKKDNVMKRKIEESQAQNKRLKDALEKRTFAEQQRKMKGKPILTNAEAQLKIATQIDSLQRLLESNKLLEKKLKQREELSAILEQAKQSKKKKKDKKVLSEFQEELDFCNEEIRRLQKDVVELDEEKIMNNIKCCIMEGADYMKAINAVVDLLKKKDESSIEDNPETVEDSENNSEDDDLEDELKKYQEKVRSLKQKIEAKKHSTPKKRWLAPPEVVLETSESEFEDENDLKKDPDWKKTPLFKRVKKLSRLSKKSRESSFEGVKRSNEGQPKCKCNTQCKTRICPCRKNNEHCDSRCNCDGDLCHNKEKVDKELLFHDKENSSEVEVKKSKLSDI